LTNNNTHTIYFSGLNGLRFFAALLVIITHIELIKSNLGIDNSWNNPFIEQLGVIGVSFFFVLSGFLITYLLLIEKEKFKKISIKKFYIRRILRIWPLYFFIFILGFIILPMFPFFEIPYFSNQFYENYWQNFILYLFIIPNLAFSMFSAVPLIGQSWSIGVEEQFYILWPLIIRLKKKITFKFLFYLFTIVISLKIIVLMISLNYIFDWIEVLKKFTAMLKFENMIIGAMGALVLKNNKTNILKLIYNPILFIFSFFCIFFLIYIIPNKFLDGKHIIDAIFFIIIILNISSNPKSLISLENKVFNFLGKISYGIYMYHMIVIFISIKILNTSNLIEENYIIFNVVLYILSLGITILVSNISYIYLEKRFLSLKSRYSNIETSNNS